MDVINLMIMPYETKYTNNKLNKNIVDHRRRSFFHFSIVVNFRKPSKTMEYLRTNYVPPDARLKIFVIILEFNSNSKYEKMLEPTYLHNHLQ